VNPDERRQWGVLLGIVCLLVGWNYWLDKFFFSSPFALFGGGFHDFGDYYLAAEAWLSHANPYVASPFFIYPPTSLPFFALYAQEPFHFAAQLWWITYFTCFTLATAWLLLTLKNNDRRLLYATIAAFLFFTSYPLLVLFQSGQVDLLAEALAILSLAFQRSKHDTVSAVMLAFAVLLKGPAVLLLAYFVLFRRDFSYLLRFLLSAGVIVGVSLLIVPVGDYWYYFIHVMPTFSGVLAFNYNQSIVGLLALAHLNYIAPVVSLAGYVLLCVFSYWAGSLSRRMPSNLESLSSDLIFLVNVLVMLLFNPKSTIYPYVWVILPLALFLSGILMEPVRPGWLVIVGLGTFLLNSNLAPSFFSYKVLPLEIIGNIMTTACLVILYIRPSAAFLNRSVKQ